VVKVVKRCKDLRIRSLRWHRCEEFSVPACAPAPAAFVHALDDFHDAADVARAVRNDEYISIRIGRQMSLLRNSGRSSGTNWAALTFFTVMIWVTISSEFELTLFGKSIEGSCRHRCSE